MLLIKTIYVSIFSLQLIDMFSSVGWELIFNWYSVSLKVASDVLKSGSGDQTSS